MAWIPRGEENNSLVQPSPDGQSLGVPALATHRGSLWCLWSSPSSDLYYAIGNNDTFSPRNLFPDHGIPVLAELLGTLHVIIVRPTGAVVHYLFDDVQELWSEPVEVAGLESQGKPALISWHNKLCLVFLKDQALWYSMWVLDKNEATVWTPLQELSGIQKVKGIPALFVVRDKLHVLCGSAEDEKEVLGFVYDIENDVWNTSADVTEGKAVNGVSATSHGSSAFLAFQEEGPDGEANTIYVTEFKDGEWLPQEPIPNQVSVDPPQLAILNGRMNCVFNGEGEDSELKWYSRSLLNFELESWMSGVKDSRLLSDITIPGTHDSCARSNIPFVRTQYLSIAQQLTFGIRFLDLRVRVHDDGQLYMYHGGIPINFPIYLKFDSVMQEIFDHFDKYPSESVLVSINNDDTSGKKGSEIFYDAIQSHIEEHSERWITSTGTGTMAEARGKAVLLRRFHAPDSCESPAGLDLSEWLDDNPDFTLRTPSGAVVTLQDKWKYSDRIALQDLVDSKYGFVEAMLEKAKNSGEEEWHLNFCSAVGDPVEKGEVAESHWIAVGAHSGIIGKFVEGMNPTVRRRYEWDLGKRYGILALDYPELPKDNDLVSLLIGTNF
ncbi:phosphatidylinositol-specific phospholipase [Penicillium taxi]|uniref:phosphatidylinositol-specific phospholipase n=1 Tax=Penicillium taxi TaxID=168475 RepID=UPI0025456AA8|nr:phosphatidylinositol-specific phospholipase [Penicillium taxi]KAJ5898996.1 phosphatidylinositol-specific phospholipase [Penicillium taxi]